MNPTSTGSFHGVGVGPGDPELITLKAARLIQNADVLAYLSSSGRSQARNIAAAVIADARTDQLELPVDMPMCEDRDVANRVYDQAARDIETHLQQGRDVVFLCEGDPLFYGSFAYLNQRLADWTTAVIPGVSSVHAASAALHQPLTVLAESFAVVSGRHGLDRLTQTLQAHDTVVIMKAGRSRATIIEALRTTKRVADAVYLEYIGRENQLIETDIERLAPEPGPYFSLFLVTRRRVDL